MHDCYSLVFLLRNFGLVWPTRLIFLAMGEVLCDGFNLVALYRSDKVGDKTRICIVAIKDKTISLFILDGFTSSTSCHLD